MPRETRNSRDSFIPSSSSSSTDSPTTTTTTCTSLVAASPTVTPASPSGTVASSELIASLIEAMKAPLSSMVNSALLSAGIAPSLPVPSIVATSTPLPLAGPLATTTRTNSIAEQAALLGQAGTTLPWPSATNIAPNPTHVAATMPMGSATGIPASSSSASSGTFNTLVVPSFVSPFASHQSAALNSAAGSSTLESVIQSPGLAPTFQQPFVIGPGYSPVPYKVVSQIILGKYVNFEDLLPENISFNEPEPQLMFEGRLVFSPTPKKNKRQINDIVTWLEAFTIFSLILGSYFPNRWVDLIKYKLLILRTYRQFSGSAWLNYDKEFREQAAAERQINWSTMSVQLYNFHTAGAQVRPRVSASSTVTSGQEAEGSKFSKVICHSWNAGRCIAPSTQCRFRHACSTCSGEHRSVSCYSRSSKSEHSRHEEHSDVKRRKR